MKHITLFCSIVGCLATGVNARDPGQWEAADSGIQQPRDRPHIDVGTEIPNNKLKWDKSNPTGHAIIFLSRNGYVFCCVQPGGA